MAENPSTLIRAATEADLPQLLELERSCYGQPWGEAQFRAELAASHAHLDLCFVAGTLAGYHCWWLLQGELEVLNLATAPGFRRRGIAAGLLEAALATAQNAGLERALLEVRAGNTGAIALYRRFGFREYGRRPRYYHDGEDALLMERTGRL